MLAFGVLWAWAAILKESEHLQRVALAADLIEYQSSIRRYLRVAGKVNKIKIVC